TAWVLNRLSEVVRDRGDRDRAEQCYRRALAIWEKLAPSSSNEAESLAGVASILHQRGQADNAAQLVEQALNALEAQISRLGGAEETRAGFRGKYESYYKDYIDLLIAQGRTEVALQVLERSRARALMETLATAHVDVRQGANLELVAQE